MILADTVVARIESIGESDAPKRFYKSKCNMDKWKWATGGENQYELSAFLLTLVLTNIAAWLHCLIFSTVPLSSAISI